MYIIHVRENRRETGYIGYTSHRTKTNNQEKLATLGTQATGRRQTIQRNWQHWVHKPPDEDKQSRDTGNIGYTSHRTKTNKDIWNTLLLTTYQIPLSTRLFWIHYGWRFPKYHCQQGYMEYLIADDLPNAPINKDIWNTLSLTIYQISLPTRIYGIHYHWQFTKIPLFARKYGIPYRWRFIKCPCQQSI